eukprot:CAMPEP_0196705334 /NCGR_PEP_ID=MMETSP1090-20130531/59681_1 /TAXON_ID=37098 /ORGANISM="Isochrysis sp, Strain CCMP1244" /LENGTH=57 /DNA_ID=CAMNT_0042045237 /DNA_START=279 /DNA_END=448 /DNA_ORIENTATION=+
MPPGLSRATGLSGSGSSCAVAASWSASASTRAEGDAGCVGALESADASAGRNDTSGS